jgi:putative proteasome-type protease
MLHDSWGERLRHVFDSIEDPAWEGEKTTTAARAQHRAPQLKKITAPSEKLV